MKTLKETIIEYCDILNEAYKFEDANSAFDAIQNKKLGVKVNPNFMVSNDNVGKVKGDVLKNRLSSYFTKAHSMGISDLTYGVQFLISHTSSIDELSKAVNNDALYEFLKSYKKPWVKQLSEYNDFINKPYNENLWHTFEKHIQDEQSKHGKVAKGTGDINGVKILYPKDKDGWELKIPLNFQGSKAAAFYGKEGEKEEPTKWCYES